MAANCGVIFGYIFLFQFKPTCRKVVPLASTISDGVMIETLSDYDTQKEKAVFYLSFKSLLTLPTFKSRIGYPKLNPNDV